MQRSSTSERLPDVIIVHETNGRKYFEAITHLRKTGVIASVKFYEASVIWKFLHSLVKERRSIRDALRQLSNNIWLRMTFWTLKDKVVIMGVAPWDFRFLLYSTLRLRNRFIYHTSWPYWTGARVPKRFGILNPLLQNLWLRILTGTRVDVVAVTSASADGLSNAVFLKKKPAVIPHVVSDVFFSKKAIHTVPFKLVLVGELAEHKGLARLQDLLDQLRGEAIELEIVGDGPLRDVVIELQEKYAVRWHGRISDRSKLAKIVAECQCLISPAVRSPRWEELFGMSIVEAMASGLPCIVTDHCGPRSIISSGINGVIVADEGPIPEMAFWIRKLSKEPETWRKMSKEAKAAAEHYRLSETSEYWAKVLGCGPIDVHCV